MANLSTALANLTRCFKNSQKQISLSKEYEYLNETNLMDTLVFWIHAVYFPIAEFGGLVLQLILFITVCKSPKLRKPRFYLITSLALGDMIWISIITPLALHTVYTGKWTFSGFVCQAQGYLLYVLALQTKLTLTLVTYDRHQAICKAVTYRQFVTSKKYLVLCIFGWVYPGILAMPPLFGWNSYTLNIDYFLCHITWASGGYHSYYIYLLIGIGLVFPCNVAIIVFYIKIFVAAHETNKNMVNTRNSYKISPFKREIKVAKGVGLVIGLYFLSSLPLTIVKYVEMFYGDSDILTCIAQISHLFFTIPHFINPLIYGWMNREFKLEFRRLWNLKKNKSTLQSNFRERLGTGTSSFSETFVHSHSR